MNVISEYQLNFCFNLLENNVYFDLSSLLSLLTLSPDGIKWHVPVLCAWPMIRPRNRITDRTKRKNSLLVDIKS